MKKLFSKNIDKIITLFLVILSVLIFKLMFIPGSFYTHDDIHHTVRVYNYSQELKNGQFPVRMATQMASGYSYPIFNYVYPLPYFLTSIIYLAGISLTASYKIILVSATFLSIIFFYFFLRLKNKHMTSLLGTLLFLFVPYRFLTIFVTGQIGAVISLFFAPILLYLAQKILDSKKKQRYIVLFAFSLSGLILSHIISAVIIIPLIIIYFITALFQKPKKKQRNIAISFSISIILAITISSSYLIPIFSEVKYIKAGHENIVDYNDHFVSIQQLIYSKWDYGSSDKGFNDLISFQLGIVHWLTLISSILFIFLAFISKKVSLINKLFKDKKFLSILIFTTTILFSIFLMTPYSKVLWDNISVLAKVQHPWRLLLVPLILIPIIGTELFDKIKYKYFQYIIFILILLSSIFLNRNYLRPMETTRYDDDHYVLNREWIEGSSDISWEFIPINSVRPPKPPNIKEGEPEFTRIDPGVLINKNEAYQQTNTHMKFNLITDSQQDVTLNILNFISWETLLDGKKIDHQSSDRGLITVNVPEGEHLLEVKLKQTNIQIIADIISIVSILVAIGLLLNHQQLIKPGTKPL